MSDENVGGLVELLPCPFCGSAPELKWHGSGVPGMEDCGYVGIDCCIAHAHADDDESAITQWNTRVSAHGQPVVDEAFERAMKESWEMVNPHPTWAAGSYFAGQNNGMIAALQTVRENYDRAKRAALTAALTGATP